MYEGEENNNNGDGAAQQTNNRRKKKTPQRFAYRGVSGVAVGATDPIVGASPSTPLVVDDEVDERRSNSFGLKSSKPTKSKRVKRNIDQVRWHNIREVDEYDALALGSFDIGSITLDVSSDVMGEGYQLAAVGFRQVNNDSTEALDFEFTSPGITNKFLSTVTSDSDCISLESIHFLLHKVRVPLLTE